MTATKLRARESADGLPPILAALWHDARGEWERAHGIAQTIATADGSLVHAYLHRKEGDSANAAYWYARAGIAMPDMSLDSEWEELVGTLGKRNPPPKSS